MKSYTKKHRTKTTNATTQPPKRRKRRHHLNAEGAISTIVERGITVIKTLVASLFFAVATLFFAYIIGGFLGVFGILSEAVAIRGMQRLLMYPVTFVCMATIGFFFLLVAIDLVRSVGDRHSAAFTG